LPLSDKGLTIDPLRVILALVFLIYECIHCV